MLSLSLCLFTHATGDSCCTDCGIEVVGELGPHRPVCLARGDEAQRLFREQGLQKFIGTGASECDVGLSVTPGARQGPMHRAQKGTSVSFAVTCVCVCVCGCWYACSNTCYRASIPAYHEIKRAKLQQVRRDGLDYVLLQRLTNLCV